MRRHSLKEEKVDSTAEIPDRVFYHRKCYQRFTLKRDLEKLKSLDQKIQTQIGDVKIGNEIDCTTRKSKRECSATSILPRECIFCKKRKTKSRVEQSLVLCIDERARELITECAKKKGNYYINSIPYLILNEAHYHKSCYQTFTKEDKDIKTDFESEAFKDVVKFCLELETFRTNEIIPFKFLLSIMNKKLNEFNQSMKTSTRKHFKRSLQNKIPSLRFI